MAKWLTIHSVGTAEIKQIDKRRKSKKSRQVNNGQRMLLPPTHPYIRQPNPIRMTYIAPENAADAAKWHRYYIHIVASILAATFHDQHPVIMKGVNKMIRTCITVEV